MLICSWLPFSSTLTVIDPLNFCMTFWTIFGIPMREIKWVESHGGFENEYSSDVQYTQRPWCVYFLFGPLITCNEVNHTWLTQSVLVYPICTGSQSQKGHANKHLDKLKCILSDNVPNTKHELTYVKYIFIVTHQQEYWVVIVCVVYKHFNCETITFSSL